MDDSEHLVSITDAFRWVKSRPYIDGALMVARGTGRILDCCGTLSEVGRVDEMSETLCSIFTSEDPFKLPSDYFNFSLCNTKYQIVQIDRERVTASSKNRRKQLVVENMPWGLVMFLFSAPNQFSRVRGEVDEWARNHRV